MIISKKNFRRRWFLAHHRDRLVSIIIVIDIVTEQRQTSTPLIYNINCRHFQWLLVVLNTNNTCVNIVYVFGVIIYQYFWLTNSSKPLKSNFFCPNSCSKSREIYNRHSTMICLRSENVITQRKMIVISLCLVSFQTIFAKLNDRSVIILIQRIFYKIIVVIFIDMQIHGNHVSHGICRRVTVIMKIFRKSGAFVL